MKWMPACAKAAVICGRDADYERVPALCQALKEAGAERLLLAGRPGDQDAAWREAGLAGYLYLGCDVVAALTELHALLGTPEAA